MTEDVKAAEVEEGWEWAILEIMGRRRHAGRIREVEKFGVKMVRLDVPTFKDSGPGTEPVHDSWETRLYGGSSVYAITYTDEASVMNANKPYVSPYRISAPGEPEDDGPELFDDAESPF